MVRRTDSHGNLSYHYAGEEHAAGMMPRDGPKLEFTQGGVGEGLISGFAPIPQSSYHASYPDSNIQTECYAVENST